MTFEELSQKAIHMFSSFKGNTALYFKNLVTNQIIAYNENTPVSSASVIKVPIMAEAFYRDNEGGFSLKNRYTLQNAHKVPPSGVLTLMDEGLTLSYLDLVRLMIVISDNVATNVLIDALGYGKINERIKALGCTSTILQRKMMDIESMKNGRDNITTAGDMGIILEKLYKGEIAGKAQSRDMVEIMSYQQDNSKIPFLINDDVCIANKTGGNTRVSNDVALIYAKQPYVLCTLGDNVDEPSFGRLIQDTSKLIYDYISK